MPRDVNDLLNALREIIEEGISIKVPEIEEIAKVLPTVGEGEYQTIDWRRVYREGEHVWFAPMEFGGVRAISDGQGRKFFEVTLNGAKMFMEVGKLAAYPAAFFHWYQDAVRGYAEAEHFKKTGSMNAPWANGGLTGNTWHYEPTVPSAAIDLDGRYLHNGNWYDPLGRESVYHPDHDEWLAEIEADLQNNPMQEKQTMKQEKGPMPGRKSKKVKLPLNTGADIEGPAKKEGKLKKKTVPGTAGEKASKGKFNKSNLL